MLPAAFAMIKLRIAIFALNMERAHFFLAIVPVFIYSIVDPFYQRGYVMNRRLPFKSALISILLCSLLLFPAWASASAAPVSVHAASIRLTEEETAYRDRVGEITIGCPADNCPLLFQDDVTGQFRGITIDILDMVSEATGIAFRYQPLPSGSVTYEVLQQQHVDMVAGVELNEFNRHATGIVLTDTYLHAAKVFVCKQGVMFNPDNAMTIAVNTGSQTLEKVILQQYPQFRVLVCSSTEEALSAVLSGKADAVLQNQYTIERILRKPIYESLRIVATAAIGDSQCLASLVPISEDGTSLVSQDTTLLLSILNKGIESLDQSLVSFIIIKETAENAYQYTLWDMLYHYRFAMAGLFVSLILIIILLRKNLILHQKRSEQLAAQQRAKELAVINEQMKEQQLLLMDSLKHAEEGNRAKTSFLFNMSHDIRTPMNAILGFAEIACRNINDTEKLNDCLEKIQTSGRHLLQLINNILDMTKIESGKVTLTEEGCNLRECIERVRGLLQPDIDKKQLTLKTDLSAVKDPCVFCDNLRLNQILFNLLSNAVKFTRQGGHIWVTLKQNPCAMREYAAFELRVKDDGIGMAPEFISRVFEPFEREHTSTISQTQGTGLGMSITKNLVDLMGGAIQVVSQPGQGTEFILQFTFKLMEEPRQPETPTSAADDCMDDFAGKRLLLVEDNELNMEVAQEILCEAGFLVETACNGQVAVDMVRASTPGYYDAILMDIQMPVMNGYQASREIRGLSDKALAEIPIIALTANAFDEDKKEALSYGMNAHIAKPLDVGVLYDTLDRVLKNG